MGEKRETGLASHANVLLFIYLFIYLFISCFIRQDQDRMKYTNMINKQRKKKNKATNGTLTPMYFWHATGQERVTNYLYEFSWE